MSDSFCGQIKSFTSKALHLDLGLLVTLVVTEPTRLEPFVASALWRGTETGNSAVRRESELALLEQRSPRPGRSRELWSQAIVDTTVRVREHFGFSAKPKLSA